MEVPGSVRRIPSTPSKKMANPTPAPRPLRVFIADDAPAVSEMLVELISDRGRVEVVGVGDSEELGPLAAMLAELARTRQASGS